MTLSELASLGGIIFGLTGAILGYLSYFRDQIKVMVILQWDMKILNDPKYDETKNWGILTLTNIGRRTIYIQNAIIELPKKYGHHLMIFDSPTLFKKLSEGDPPINYFIDQQQMTQYSKDWKKIEAKVIISTGKSFKSKKYKKRIKPSWVINN